MRRIKGLGGEIPECAGELAIVKGPKGIAIILH
jgi:hypothetical protein